MEIGYLINNQNGNWSFNKKPKCEIGHLLNNQFPFWLFIK